VEFGQGYLFSKPLPLAEASTFLQTQLAASAQQSVAAT